MRQVRAVHAEAVEHLVAVADAKVDAEQRSPHAVPRERREPEDVVADDRQPSHDAKARLAGLDAASLGESPLCPSADRQDRVEVEAEVPDEQ